MATPSSPLIIPLTPAQRYRQRITLTRLARHLTQLAFVGFMLWLAVAHHLATEDGAVPSIDALCPFGGVETLWRYLSSGGQFVPKTHLSNLVLLGGLTLSVLVAGGAFCGWVCPFGAVQDALAALRRWLRLPTWEPAPALDRVLRWGRYAVLAVILYQTITTVKLWFAGVDPYRTLFSLDWLFEFNWVENWLAYTVTAGVLVGALLVERVWCRYLCPLGGLISLVGNLSVLRIGRSADSCKGCHLCATPCPVKLDTAHSTVVSANCIGCLECVQACPRPHTLDVQVRPAWWPRHTPLAQ